MRVVRIREVPAIEAALTRFDSWWAGLSARERVLVAVLGVLLGLVVAIYGVVKPIQGARAQALANIRTYETLSARIRAAGSLTARPVAVQMRMGAPADIVSGAAAGLGLAATVEVTPAGVRATIADASYDGVIGWMGELGRSSTLKITRAELVRLAVPGRVRAVVDFAP